MSVKQLMPQGKPESFSSPNNVNSRRDRGYANDPDKHYTTTATFNANNVHYTLTMHFFCFLYLKDLKTVKQDRNLPNVSVRLFTGKPESLSSTVGSYCTITTH